MALSNIFNEPRREITETVIGISAFSLFALYDWWFAFWFHKVSANEDGSGACSIEKSFLLGIIVAVVFVILLYVIHWIGESICNGLAKLNRDPRPKQRR